MSRFLSLALFVLLVVGGGSLIGVFNTPGPWYEALTKPPFNPPNWIFGPVWTVLYVLIAVAGWRTWQSQPKSSAMAAWWLQLALNFSWSPVFFTAQAPMFALVIILALLITIVNFIRLTWDDDRTAAVMFIPYAAWVGFATLLNASIVWLN